MLLCSKITCIDAISDSAFNGATVIYALEDPRTGAIRYVGKSIRLRTRIRVLIAKSLRDPKTYEEYWIRSLVRAGFRPIVHIVDVVPPGGDWQEAERRWIADMRASGEPLTNLSDGGDGMPGYRWTEEQKEKLRRPTGIPMPEAHKERLRALHTGSKHTEEHKRKISEGLRGRPVSAETREKIAKKQRGVPKPPEQVAKMKEAQAANPWVAPLPYRQQISAKLRRDVLPKNLRNYRGSKNYDRDLAVALDTRSQSVIAADYGLTQPRVSRIKRIHDAGLLRPLADDPE